MKPDASHIKQIKVISNTHWDREFKLSFEKTRRRLVDMMNFTLDLLDHDPNYKSYTLDAHSIMIEDYLEMAPHRRDQLERLIRTKRLIIGPWYTLPEMLNISAESICRNLLWGRKVMQRFSAPDTTVAYTPTSWGQTGQLPQILAGFGLQKIMFYRGISHHEADAEFLWQAPDGTVALCSRFALYARYNWYYLVHRAVTQGQFLDKQYSWGQSEEVPFRLADTSAGEEPGFDFVAPQAKYDRSALAQAIERLIQQEGPHFTTEIFLAMDGHDLSGAHPHTPAMIADANQIFQSQYTFEHTDLDRYWHEMEKYLDRSSLPVLKGERRSCLKQGLWTYLLPGSISARTYLKQQDFQAAAALEKYAEPLSALALILGGVWPQNYLDRAWQILLSNHTHDAIGGCAPDRICQDMEYRYRQVADLADIVTRDAMVHIAGNLSPRNVPHDAIQLIVYNPLPFPRDEIALVDVEIPADQNPQAAALTNSHDPHMPRQPISAEKSTSFIESIWDVPKIITGVRLRFYAQFQHLPALGYRVYQVTPQPDELRNPTTLVTGPSTMENEYLTVNVNPNGTVDVLDKITHRQYHCLNYLTDQGECGNAWKHVTPSFDHKYDTLDAHARITVVENGPLVAVLTADYDFAVPIDYADGNRRSDNLLNLPVRVAYRLEKNCPCLKIDLTVDNRAGDHWLRANFPTHITTDVSWADSHYDVVSRKIALPDSTGWVEPAVGTHPLRTFVDLSDGRDGLAVLSKGLFEYEVFEDLPSTLALTLLRAFRIKLQVSEEKVTELSDPGPQCPGPQKFEYAVYPHPGDWNHAQLFMKAAQYLTPVKLAMAGRGKGSLPQEAALFTLDNPAIQITAVKQAQDNSGLIIRFFNPCDYPQKCQLSFNFPLTRVALCRMDERELQDFACAERDVFYEIPAKKIITLKTIIDYGDLASNARLCRKGVEIMEVAYE